MTDELTYRVNYVAGTLKLKPVEHRLRWLSYDEFQVESDIMTMTGCDGSMLPMILSTMQPLTFLNERPEAPKRASWLSRFFG